MSALTGNEKLLKKMFTEDGCTYDEIGKVFNVSKSQVYRYLKELNIIGQQHEKYQDLLGKKLGKLTVLEYKGKYRYKKGGTFHKWLCKCDCGKEITVSSSNLNGGQKSCKNCVGEIISFRLKKYKIPSIIWNGIKHRCKKSALDLNIDPDYLWNIFKQQNGKCAITGIDIDFADGKATYYITASVDRIDQSKGYIKDNVRWVHKRINCMRNNMTDDEFIFWCNQVVMNNKNNIRKFSKSAIRKIYEKPTIPSKISDKYGEKISKLAKPSLEIKV